MARFLHFSMALYTKSPNQVWTTDFTYISIGPKRHVYLCAILDLYSKKCIAWKVSDKIDACLLYTSPSPRDTR